MRAMSVNDHRILTNQAYSNRLTTDRRRSVQDFPCSGTSFDGATIPLTM